MGISLESQKMLLLALAVCARRKSRVNGRWAVAALDTRLGGIVRDAEVRAGEDAVANVWPVSALDCLRLKCSRANLGAPLACVGV